jgi:hypothetical protein
LNVTFSGAFPRAGEGDVVSRATGAWFNVTFTVTLACELRPSASKTIRVAEHGEQAPYWCDAVAGGGPEPESAVVPSP